MNKILKYLKHPQLFLLKLDQKKFIKLNDKKYIELRYFSEMGKRLNLNKPYNFNEKLQWLKLYNRKDEYTIMCDKYLVRDYISNTIGEQYLIPLIGVYDKFDDIDFLKLPNKFVIKCSHDSGSIVICENKDNFDINKAKKIINSKIKKDYYRFGREWPYKNIVPKIIVEEYMEDIKCGELIDYKLFCFNGEPNIKLICSKRRSKKGVCETWFDKNWELLDIKEGGHDIDSSVRKPINYKLMDDLSRKLSKTIPFLRVDWYEIDGKLYFGELTFYPASGYERFSPENWNDIMGKMIKLPKVK